MIAREAELSVGAIYYHFRSVDEIYAVVLADVARLLDGYLKEVAEQPSLRAQLSAWLTTVHRVDSKDRSVVGFLIRAHLDDARESEPDPRRTAMLTGMGHFFATLVYASIARGELPPDTDVRAIVGLLATIMWGTGMYSRRIRDADAVASLARQADEVFAHGLLG
jgi:AcrR family transcriptional regulator